MRRNLSIAGSFLLVAVLASTATADVVDDFWANVTSSTLNGSNAAVVNESIRVVFVTSADVKGNIKVQSTYDGLALKSAQSGLLTQNLAVTSGGPFPWESLVTANDSTGSNPVATRVAAFGTLKVFNTNGEFVGNTNTFFSNPLANAIKYDENGLDLAADPNAATQVWTGTNSNGTTATATFDGVSTTATHLGSSATFGGGGPFGTFGDFAKTTNNVNGTNGNPNGQSWLEDGVAPFTTGSPPGSGIGTVIDITLPIYAMSGTIVAVPEPSTILMWLGFTGVAGMVYWRKRRS